MVHGRRTVERVALMLVLVEKVFGCLQRMRALVPIRLERCLLGCIWFVL